MKTLDRLLRLQKANKDDTATGARRVAAKCDASATAPTREKSRLKAQHATLHLTVSRLCVTRSLNVLLRSLLVASP
jgi:hypothetical protein